MKKTSIKQSATRSISNILSKYDKKIMEDVNLKNALSKDVTIVKCCCDC